ncbi:MAG: GH92 family glycosyl hydrolase [Ginsengibacter sp.]
MKFTSIQVENPNDIHTNLYYLYMNKLTRFLLAFATIISSCGTTRNVPLDKGTSYTKYVDPFIGTGFHGHVFLGANVPFGAVQLGPTNISQGWDWCSGYHYSDSTIIGFAHTHLSGTGIGDLGDISFMPVIGNVTMARGKAGDQNSGYYSLFSHDDETAVPGYYSVFLKRYGVMAEMTTTERVGFHRYTFPASEDTKIIVDLESGIGWDSPVKTFIEKINDSTISGYRFSTGWANDQRIYFTAIFSKPMKNFLVYDSTAQQQGTSLTARRIRGAALFITRNGEKILVKVGISPVSTQNALLNINKEIPNWDFTRVVKNADAAWNKELSRIKVETNDSERLRTFYTAMYHTMIAPSIFNDVNGDYLGTDKKVYKNTSFTNLTTFSLWDTYRAAHPLFTVIQKDRVNDMINSMLAIYQQQGKLPVWHLMGNETNTMPGHSGIQVVTDAFLKGFDGFDKDLAWEAVKNSAMQDEKGMKFVKSMGYIPADSMVESVANGLEYALSDWGIAQMAKRLGKTKDFEYFSKRSKNYQNYFDKETHFMRGRLADNSWRTPFSPFVSVHRADDFSEGNAWQYSWLVPQDVEGLIALQGGDKAFAAKLDSLFIVTGDMGKEASSDITGLIGQYAHGNEPGHHITYLYPFVGQPWKTAEKVRYILDNFYTDKHDGIIGNEDVGQMSAWYILSALGFYQVNPSNGMYVFGSPTMDKANIQLGNGNTMMITYKNNSKKNIYIQGITYNGKAYPKSYIWYKDLMAGGNMVIEMGAAPSKTFGVSKDSRPFSGMDERK